MKRMVTCTYWVLLFNAGLFQCYNAVSTCIVWATAAEMNVCIIEFTKWDVRVIVELYCFVHVCCGSVSVATSCVSIATSCNSIATSCYLQEAIRRALACICTRRLLACIPVMVEDYIHRVLCVWGCRVVDALLQFVSGGAR